MDAELTVEQTAGVTEQVRCLHTLVFDQARETPGRVAVRTRDSELTYNALVSQARRLARHLVSLGANPEMPVGVCLPRSCDLIVAMLGILGAGAAYVPLDPTYPDERLALLLDDTDAPLVVTTTSIAQRLSSHKARVVLLDAEADTIAAWSDEPLEDRSASSHLAYLIYTSGSTGRPKGVMIEHRNAAALIAWAHGQYSAQDLSRVVAGTSIAFDLSVFEIFVPLSRGGSIDLIEHSLAFAHWPDRGRATLINTVPSVMRELVALSRTTTDIARSQPRGRTVVHRYSQQRQGAVPGLPRVQPLWPLGGHDIFDL